ncbi:MAG: hypothetical protein ABII12_05635 [Planctomycetota bacterium]
MDEMDVLSREEGREHLAALEVLRHAKNVFIWLALVAVVLHVLSWIMLRQASSPQAARDWELTAEWMLAMAGFVARASVLVVTGVFVLALLVSLSAKLGGAAGLAKTCVWSLAALAMLVPWVRLSSEDVVNISSAVYGVDELSAHGPGAGGGADAFFSFVRFGICPILVAVCLGAAQYCFRSVYRRIAMPSATRLPIREV